MIFAGASTVLILLLKSDLSFVVRVVKKSKSEFCRFDLESRIPFLLFHEQVVCLLGWPALVFSWKKFMGKVCQEVLSMWCLSGPGEGKNV